MFGRIPDAIICILLGIFLLAMAEDVAKIPGHSIYAFLSVVTAAIGFGAAAFITWPTRQR